MDGIEPQGGANEKGRKVGVFVPPPCGMPPLEWPLSNLFWPAWIPCLAYTKWIPALEPLHEPAEPAVLRLLDRYAGPLVMPALAAIEDEHHGYGRPRTEVTRGGTIHLMAWLVDMAGMSKYQLTKELYGDPKHDAYRKRVSRDVVAGRRLLSSMGALPWRAWGGAQPPRDWWQHREFLKALDAWVDQAIARAAGIAVDPPVDQETEVLMRLRGRMMNEILGGMFPGGPPPLPT
jgi:hypothetical protein